MKCHPPVLFPVVFSKYPWHWWSRPLQNDQSSPPGLQAHQVREMPACSAILPSPAQLVTLMAGMLRGIPLGNGGSLIQNGIREYPFLSSWLLAGAGLPCCDDLLQMLGQLCQQLCPAPLKM